MLKLCTEFSLSDVLSNDKDLELLLKSATPIVIEILDSSCFIEAYSTRLIKNLNWPRGFQFISYLSKNCIAIPTEIENLIEKEY